jgi:hypothetical protein
MSDIEPGVQYHHRLQPEARPVGGRLIYDRGVQTTLDLG